MKKLLISTAAALIIASPALGEVSQLKTKTVTTTTPVTSAVLDANTAHFVKPGDADFIISSIINSSVKNNSDETIGEIKDVVIRKNQVEGFVIAVGGFLGIGDKYVVVDPSSIRMSLVNGAWKISINASKDVLKAAPQFKYEGKWAH